MANDGPKYVKDCPVMMPSENLRVFSAMKGSYDKAWSGHKFEAGFRDFKSGYSDPRFNGHNQSCTLSTSNKNKN